jgi:adenylyl-sulfate kinase
MKKALTLWFTGMSGAGKSTLSARVAEALKKRGIPLELLDGDEVRTNLSAGLTFSKEDRDLNIRRIAYVCHLLNRNGVWAISAAISPYREMREQARKMIGGFVEIYVEASLDTLAKRDVKGLYKKAMAGEIKNFTGVSDPYEPPVNPEIKVNSETQSPDESFAIIMKALEKYL